jgi:hypothetical protein
MHRASFAFLFLAACASHTCPNDVVPAVIVTVVDAASNAQVCDALVTATIGSHAYTLPIFDQPQPGTCNYQTAGGPPGRYTISVNAPHYQSAQVGPVTVSADDCDLAQTQSVQVGLALAH